MFDFSVDRKLKKPLVEQVLDGLRREIVSGRFPVGSTLPSRKAIAEELGIGEKIVRLALESMSAAGEVATRRRTGSEVIARPELACKGHVLFVFPEHDPSFYIQRLYREVQACLARRSYLAFTASPDWSCNGFSPVVDAFAGLTQLAVVLHGRQATIRGLEQRGLSYLTVGEKHYRGKRSVGHIQICREYGVPSFVDYCCVRRKVSRVLEVVFSGQELDVGIADALVREGVSVETLRIKSDFHKKGLDDVQTCAHDAVAGYLSGITPERRPEMVYFSDDYLAFGGIAAIVERGFSIPDEIQVTTWYNRGFGPFPWLGLPRLEMDAVKHGKIIAKAILRVLENRRPLEPLQIRSEFKCR